MLTHFQVLAYKNCIIPTALGLRWQNCDKSHSIGPKMQYFFNVVKSDKRKQSTFKWTKSKSMRTDVLLWQDKRAEWCKRKRE